MRLEIPPQINELIKNNELSHMQYQIRIFSIVDTNVSFINYVYNVSVNLYIRLYQNS